MKILWNWIGNKDISYVVKTRLFLLLNCMIYGFMGFVVWMIARNFAFDSVEWAICFIGYPGFVIGYLGGFLFLYRQ